MTCAELQDALPDYVEDRLDAGRRAAVEAHLASCAACRALADDLREIRQVARALERHSPPRGSWTRLAERLAAAPPGATPPRAVGDTGSGRGRWMALALAASLLAAIGLSLIMLGGPAERAPATAAGTSSPAPASAGSDAGAADPRPAAGPGNAAASGLVESVESEVQLAADHLEKAASGLEQIASQADSTVDPEVMAKLKQSLAVIDTAIGDSRTALRAQPENRVAQESLFDAFRRKVALLQDTIALMNEMRKGNQAGAARIAESEKS